MIARLFGVEDENEDGMVGALMLFTTLRNLRRHIGIKD